MHKSYHIHEWVSSHMWMNHVTRMNWSCHTCDVCVWESHVMLRCTSSCAACAMWMSHVTYMNESCRIYEWVLSHVWCMGVRVTCDIKVHTNMHESCHICEWVMSHIWMNHVTYMNESCHIYEWVIPLIWMSQFKRMIYECNCHMWCQGTHHVCVCVCVCVCAPSCAVCAICMNHVTYVNESCHI